MKRTFLAAAATLALVTGACANSSSGARAGAGDGRTYPTAADQVVVRIATGGGFIAPSYAVTQLPQFSLMGDGSAITPGAIPEIYPGPAIAPLFSQAITPDGIQAILSLAETDGLTGPDHDYTDMGSVGIADAATTTITIVADGSTHTFNFYALDMLSGKKPPMMPQDEFDARTKAQNFTTKMSDLSWLPAGSTADPIPFEPTAVRVFVSDYHADPDVTEPEIAWPLATDLVDFGDAMKGAANLGAMGVSNALPSRCGVATGQDLGALSPLISAANQLSPWKSGGRNYGLLFRPLLPDESGC